MIILDLNNPTSQLYRTVSRELYKIFEMPNILFHFKEHLNQNYPFFEALYPNRTITPENHTFEMHQKIYRVAHEIKEIGNLTLCMYICRFNETVNANVIESITYVFSSLVDVVVEQLNELIPPDNSQSWTIKF